MSVLMQAIPDRGTVLFTLLEEYQRAADKSSVEPFLTLQYFTELSRDKGVVLMKGDVDEAKVTTTEAQYLVNQLQIHYITDDRKFERVKTFNHRPEAFNYDEVVADLKGAASVGE